MIRLVWGCVLGLVMLSAACARAPQEKQRLEEVYMPTFSRVPPREPAAESLRVLWTDWRNGGAATLARDLASAQGVALALAAGLILLIAWDYRRPTARRNIDLLLLFGSGLLFFDVMRFFDVIRSPSYLNLLDWVFWAVFAVGVALIVRAVHRVTNPLSDPWTPHLPVPALVGLLLALLAANAWIALARAPDDAGFFVNLGAQRLRERGRLPYGDPLLTGTPGAAYGPLLYAAHVPFQVLVSPEPVNAVSPARPNLVSGEPYYLPPAAATQLCTLAFHLLGVLALVVAARRLAGMQVALAIACLYCGSLAVLGIGGQRDQVAGITFVSHIAPASVTLLALAALQRAVVSGVLLAIAAGIGFYPAFMAPAWLGYYWNDRPNRIRFVVGFGLAAAIIAAGVYATSRPAGDRSRLGTILYDTFGHHTDPAGYGSSVFGFWGQRGGIRQALTTPTIGTSGLTTPAWLTFAAFLAATFFLARGRRPTDLALLAGAVALAATLVKPHATGTYLAWFYPLLLLGWLGSGFTSRPHSI